MVDSVGSSTAKSGVGTSSLTQAMGGSESLGKDAFLKLLVEQIKNQDPLEPKDNSEFVAQLAQFSSLEGITTLNDTVSGIAGNYNSSQALQASSLVGRSVIAQTDKAVVDTSKSLNGTVVVPTSVSAATVKITNSAGTVIRTLDLGSQSAGNASFIWDGKDSSGAVAPAGTYTFGATTTIDGTNTSLITYLPATVNSVTISQTGGELMLNLAGLGSVALSKVQTIGL